MSTRASGPAFSVSENAGPHFPFIRQKIPAWLADTALPRINALGAFQPVFPPAHKDAHNPARPAALKEALGAHWAAQNSLDKKLQPLNDIAGFAEPLLKAALKAYGDIDVQHTFIRLYTATGAIKPGIKSRTLSLLNAALHNFAVEETFEDYAFLSAADARGQQDLLTFTHQETRQVLTAQTFKRLCRNLDIGARYQRQVRATLGFNDPQVSDALRQQVTAHQRAALNSAAHLALANQHITPQAYALIQAIVRGEAGVQLGGHDVEFHTLDLLETRLTGVLVIAPSGLTPFGANRLLVYIPEDPLHPLKEYPAFGAFGSEFAQRLRGTPEQADAFPGAYAQFISQFIAHAQRGRFFPLLKQRLFQWRRVPRPPEEGPVWTEQSTDRPNLEWRLQAVQDDTQNRACTPVCDDIWQYLYRVKLNKIINDAQQIAVSTEYADRMARWAWWDNLENIASQVFNLALLVITPFVPFLGELMLAYTAYQLANDVFEGLIDWAQGHSIEAQEHLLSAVQNVVQGLLFERGGKLVEVARVKLSPFVDGLKPVQLANGETRLWNPDLTPYQHTDLALPAASVPDEAGRHAHQGKQIVQVDGQHYQVGQDPITDEHHLIHPLRPDAYRPPVRLNGSGACVLEHEAPRSWSDARLMRRLGPQTQGLSDRELEQVRVISATDHAAVRHMYVNNEPAPPLLTDTLKRFASGKRLTANLHNLRSGQALDPASYWFEQMVTELKGWPQDKALHVYQRADYSGTLHRYGNPSATGSAVLTLSTGEVMGGQLPEKVLAFLDPAQIDTLLGETLPADQQAQALREQLARHVERHSEAVIQDLCWPQELSSDPAVQLLRTQYPELPLSIARQLLRHGRRRDLNAIDEDKRLTLDVKNQLRELDFEVTSTRLFEQLEQRRTLSVKAESLIHNTLLFYSDALAGLRIEVRDTTPWGEVRSATGASDAPTVRVLVRDQKAQYRVHDLNGKKLHGPADFYTATQRCLVAPAAFTEGESLRRWVLEKTAEPATRRQVLADPPIAKTIERHTLTLLKGGNTSRLSPPQASESAHERLQRRIKTLLPEMSEDSVKSFARQSHTTEGQKLLETLEAESKALHLALEAYKKSPTRWPEGSVREAVTRRIRKRYAEVLMKAWREGHTRWHESASTRLGAVSLDLSDLPRPDKLPTLPVPLKYVGRLEMNGCDFTADRASFLEHFPNLRALHLESNRLETVPAAITRMRALEELNLANNQIMLDPEAIARLRTMSRLRRLSLADNPLGAPPDISLMPELTILQLGNTRITQWPIGLFAQQRDQNFILELHGNPITTVPEARRGSEHAVVIALTRLDRARLSIDYQDLFESYRESVGLDPVRTYEPMGDSGFWIEDLDDVRQDEYRDLWDDVENEPGSQGFFEVIKALERPERFQDAADKRVYDHNLPYLKDQVLTMLSAMAHDPALREKLFKLSTFPGLCPDAGRQIFNEMGIEVAASQARNFSKTAVEREAKLVKLARGAARLKLLNDVARADIAHRITPKESGGAGLRLTTQMVDGVPGTVDEVEVYLAYQTRLARQLDLPWVNEHMLYRRLADVSEDAIKRAYTSVLELSQGHGLVDQMLLEPYWERFLVEHYPDEYAQNQRDIDARYLLLDQLQDGMQASAQAENLSEAARAEQLAALRHLGEQLNLPAAQITQGEPLSDALYSQVLNELGDLRKQWLREKTEQSLGVIA